MDVTVEFAHPLAGSSYEATARRFVEIAREFSWVRRVALLESDVPEIRTEIEAPPFDRAYRDPVYDAELAAILDAPGAHPDFSLMNRLEREQPFRPVAMRAETVILVRD